ncbi:MULTISPECIES: hypothetical protein [unclassified Sinorhizobium]|uniref:hypothetical protein n=1 Tax=unclassified Sinorhizobium TaxID=2613772 RepID=UPI0024C3DE9F|nr:MULTISPECIES: hypothetical protein [unclassified Sinorhizobium]MDK1373400.1 hypothetical protein [Sinorhizobium sp. 6-70]MDK1482833.1 hypothetical protein [Sinorhizobium sp. 6-117]
MAARMATMPEMAQSDAVKSDAVKSNTVKSDTVTSDMIMPDTAQHGDCQDCPDQPDGMKAMACGNVCAAAVIAPLPLAALVPDGEDPTSILAPDLSLDGRTLPPDPDPPRTSDIG